MKAGVWVAVLAATVITGLGNGVLIVAFNTVFASGFGDRSPAMVSLLNAAFGCGAVAGPLALGVVLGTHFRALFLLEALCTLCLIPALLSTPDDRRSRASSDPGDPPPPLHLLVTFIAFFLVYEGVEANLGGWEATQLTARGLSTSAAANATAVFWAALTAGRIVLAPLSAWVPLERILVAALTILTLLMLLAHVQGLTVVAYTLAGFAISLVFPLAFVWLDRTFPRNMSAPSLCLVGALLGGIIFPLGVGKWIAASTPEVLPTALTIFAVLSLLTALSLQWRLAPPRAYVGRRIPG